MRFLLLFELLFALSLFSYSQSFDICGNGIDDDGDGQIDEACAKFPCNGSLYQTAGSTLYKMGLSPVSFTQIASLSHKVNGTGYNPVDNYVYSFMDEKNAGVTNTLIRIDANGDYESLGELTYNGTSLSDVFAADVSIDGILYFIHNTTLYALDLETMALTDVLTRSERMTDFAFNPTNEKLYGISDSKNLHELDPVAKVDNNLGKLTADFNMTTGSVGATYFTLTGELVTYGVYSGSTWLQNDLVFVDIDNLTASMKEKDAIANSSMDGCSCPYTIKLEKSASDTVVNPGDSFTYSFTIYNLTGFAVPNARLVDTLDSRLTITSISTPFNNTVVLQGLSTNVLVVDKLTIPVGETKLSIDVVLDPLVSCTEPDIANQAQLENIPSIETEFLVSDDPRTVKEFDTTWVFLDRGNADAGTLSVANFGQCSAIDTVVTVSGAKGTVSWEQSVDSKHWVPYAGVQISDTSIQPAIPQLKDSTVIMYYRAVVVEKCDTAYSYVIMRTLALPVVDLGNDTVVCGPSSVELSMPGTFGRYEWSTGEKKSKISITQSGIYSVTATKGACSASDSIEVLLGAIGDVLDRTDTAICKGQSLTFSTVNSFDSYLWSSGDVAPSITVADTGLFSITVTQGSCSATDSVHVSYIEIDSLDLGKDVVQCLGSTVHISAPAGYDSYAWSTGESTETINVLVSGSYVLDVTKHGCTSADTIAVLFQPQKTPSVQIKSDKTTFCSGNTVALSIKDSANLGNAPSFSWTVNGVLLSSSSATVTIDTLTENCIVTLTAESSHGCVTSQTVSSSVALSVEKTPEVQLVTIKGDSIICPEQHVTLQAYTNMPASVTSFEWAVNNNIVPIASDTYTSSGLQAGDVVVLRAAVTHVCIANSVVADTVIVQQNPIPHLLLEKNICSGNEPLLIDAENKGNHLGSFVVEHSNGVEFRNDSAFFNPQGLAKGTYAIVALWTDTLGCSAKTSETVTIHDVPKPEGKTAYASASSSAQFQLNSLGYVLYWYDSAGTVLASGTEKYVPSEPCSKDECIFTYYAQNYDPATGCYSDSVPITHAITNCIVPMPRVSDTIVCKGNGSYTLFADTAQLGDWTIGAPKGASEIYWYKSVSDAQTSYLHKGTGSFTMPETATGTYGYCVRQYNAGKGCFSAPVPLSATIWQTPAIVQNKQTKNVCEEEPFELEASGTNVNWYADEDTTVLLLSNSSRFVGDVAQTYDHVYATQSKNGCQSDPVKYTIAIHEKPAEPEIAVSFGCDLYDVQNIVARVQSGSTVVWFGSDGQNLLQESDSLTLNESQLSLGANLFYVQAQNIYGCTSDMVPVEYMLYHTPRYEYFVGDTLLCQGTSNATLEYKSSGATQTHWFSYGLERGEVAQGHSYTLPKDLGLGVHHYSAVGEYEGCALDTFAFSVRVIESPNFSIVGETMLCESNFGQEYHVTNVGKTDEFRWSITGNRHFYGFDHEGTFNLIKVDWVRPGIDTIYATGISDEGCRWTDSLIVAVGYPTKPDFTVSVDNSTQTATFYNSTEPLVLEDSIPFGTTFSWYFPGAYSPYFYQDNEHFLAENEFERVYPYGYYDVTLVSDNVFGCKDSVTKSLFVDMICRLFVPDAFQPTHESLRLDVFRVLGTNLSEFDLTIYDNWGNLVWHTDKLCNGSPCEFWDGRANGGIMEQGTYMWRISATFLDGTEWPGEKTVNGKFKKHGNLILIR